MSDEVDVKIASLDDWRGALLTRIRRLVKDAVPDVIEDVKWRKPTTRSACRRVASRDHLHRRELPG